LTVRTPIKIDASNDFQEMSAGEILLVKQKIIKYYADSPTAVLTVVASSGALVDAISDTRLQAGALSQSATAFVAEGTTAEPSTVTVSYDKVNLAYTATGSISNPTDSGTTFPAYYDTSTGSIQAMTAADVLDTFIYPCIELMIVSTESGNTGGTYTITNAAAAASGYTQVSATPIFTDTRANTAAYSAAGIPETLDQPSTITNYYLHRRNSTDVTVSAPPLVINGDNDLQQMSDATISSVLANWLRYTAAHNTAGYKIVYNMASSGGNTRGTAVVDTKLNGAGAYGTLQVGDDYRSQEFPNGAAATISTYNLRINKG
jgi:hypothetical protein